MRGVAEFARLLTGLALSSIPFTAALPLPDSAGTLDVLNDAMTSFVRAPPITNEDESKNGVQEGAIDKASSASPDDVDPVQLPPKEESSIPKEIAQSEAREAEVAVNEAQQAIEQGILNEKLVQKEVATQIKKLQDASTVVQEAAAEKGHVMLETGKEQATEAQSLLLQAKAFGDGGKNQILAANVLLKNARESLVNGEKEIADGEKIEQQASQLKEKAKSQRDASEKELELKLKGLAAAAAQIKQGVTKVERGEGNFQSVLSELEESTPEKPDQGGSPDANKAIITSPSLTTPDPSTTPSSSKSGDSDVLQNIVKIQAEMRGKAEVGGSSPDARSALGSASDLLSNLPPMPSLSQALGSASSSEETANSPVLPSSLLSSGSFPLSMRLRERLHKKFRVENMRNLEKATDSIQALKKVTRGQQQKTLASVNKQTAQLKLELSTLAMNERIEKQLESVDRTVEGLSKHELLREFSNAREALTFDTSKLQAAVYADCHCKGSPTSLLDLDPSASSCFPGFSFWSGNYLKVDNCVNGMRITMGVYSDAQCQHQISMIDSSDAVGEMDFPKPGHCGQAGLQGWQVLYCPTADKPSYPQEWISAQQRASSLNRVDTMHAVSPAAQADQQPLSTSGENKGAVQSSAPMARAKAHFAAEALWQAATKKTGAGAEEGGGSLSSPGSSSSGSGVVLAGTSSSSSSMMDPLLHDDPAKIFLDSDSSVHDPSHPRFRKLQVLPSVNKKTRLLRPKAAAAGHTIAGATPKKKAVNRPAAAVMWVDESEFASK